METSAYPLLMKANKSLAVIVARGGSKGLPRKNVLSAGGKPLVAWTVDAAISAECIDRVVLSSDDDEIMTAARAAGCEVPFRRPAHLACDTASSIDVILHALDQLPGFEYVVLLQPTSPLRTAADIDAAFALMLDKAAPSCVSVTEVEHSPYWMYKVTGENRLQKLLPTMADGIRRQDLPLIYTLNGAIYIARVDWLKVNKSFISDETIAYMMPRERSIDIDTYDDFISFLSIIEAR